MIYQKYLNDFIDFFKNYSNNPVFKLFLHIQHIINYNSTTFNFIFLILIKFFIILFTIFLPIFIIIYSYHYLSHISNKHKIVSWTDKNNIYNFYLNRYDILNNFYNFFDTIYLSSAFFIYTLSCLLFSITYLFIKLKIPNLLLNNSYDIFLNISFSFFIAILFILIIFYIFNYKYYYLYYKYNNEYKKIFFDNLDIIYFNLNTNEIDFIRYPTITPTENNILNYFTSNIEIFQFQDNLFDNVTADTNIDALKNKLKPTLDNYVKTLITHQLITLLYNNNTLNLNNDLKFCTYIDMNELNYPKPDTELSEDEQKEKNREKNRENNGNHINFPNLFYCLKNNVSQPFNYLNIYEKDFFDRIENNLFKIHTHFPVITNFISQDELKKFAIQYITNEYTTKINQISNNFNDIKNISFNETYIILFIISVIIIYSILLFFI